MGEHYNKIKLFDHISAEIKKASEDKKLNEASKLLIGSGKRSVVRTILPEIVVVCVIFFSLLGKRVF